MLATAKTGACEQDQSVRFAARPIAGRGRTMWPDDYIDWARQTQPIVIPWTRDRLRHYPILAAEAPDLAQSASRAAFQLANAHRHYPG
jgi:hypothetical protein